MRYPTLRFLAGRLGCYLAAVTLAYLLACATATQYVVARLAAMGVHVPLVDRLAMTLQDLAGMANMFLPMVAFALLVAFMAAALLNRWLSRFQWLLYALAGGSAVVTIHLVLHAAFGIIPIAIARSPAGLLAQGVAGAAGGLAYLWLTRQQGGIPRDLSGD